MMSATELLTQIEALGIHLAVTPEHTLKINAPKGTLTLDIKRDLSTYKAELITLLSSRPGFTSYDHFVDTVKTLGDELAEETQQDWTITLIPPGYTLDQHIARLRTIDEQKAAEFERAMWRKIREARAYVGIPRWLVPGTEDWNKQVARNGEPEMRERRQAWFDQQQNKQLGVIS